MSRRIAYGVLLSCFAALLLSCAKGGDSSSAVVIPKNGSGMIRVRLMFNAGSAYDPTGKEGLADFTTAALRRGSRHYSRTEIDEKLDDLAARIDFDVDRDVVVVEGLCLTESWPEFSDLLFSVLTEPVFDSTEMVRLVDDQLDAIEQIRRDDGDLAKAALQYYIYYNHPYGHPVEGLTHAVETITPADVRNFYNTYYTSNNYILGLAGDVSDSLAASINARLKSALPNTTPPAQILPQPTVSGIQVHLIEKENRAQAQLRFGRPIEIGRQDAAFMPLFLANTFLGRHRESMGLLYQTIRAKRGLSYGAYSYAEHFDQDRGSNLARPGKPRRQQYFSAWVYPKSINAKFVIKIVLKTLTDLYTNGLTEEQLAAAKKFEINHFPFEIETPRRLLGMRMDEVALHTPAFVDSFATRAQAVTVNEVHEALEQAVDPSNIVIVAIVSNGEEFAKQFLGSQVMHEYPSGVDPESLRADDIPFTNFPLHIKVENVHIVRADEMFR